MVHDETALVNHARAVLPLLTFGHPPQRLIRQLGIEQGIPPNPAVVVHAKSTQSISRRDAITGYVQGSGVRLIFSME